MAALRDRSESDPAVAYLDAHRRRHPETPDRRNEYLPEKGKVIVPTIFSLAKAQGLPTAMFVSKQKFEHLNLPGSVDFFDCPPDKNPSSALNDTPEWARPWADLTDRAE